MEHTAVTVLEVGAILLAAALAGRVVCGLTLQRSPSEVYAGLIAAVAISIAVSSIGVRLIRPVVRGGDVPVPST